MRFQDIYDVENKQRLNISDHAHAVLVNDMSVFRREDAQNDSCSQVSSGIINHIVRVFREDAETSIMQTLRRKRREYLELFAEMEDSSAREKAVELCLAADKKQLMEESLRRQKNKDYACSIRIDKENLAFLASEEGQAEGKAYRGNVGNYIKALIEEYCECPYVEREKIYFHENLHNFRVCVAEQKALKLTLHSKKPVLSGGGNNILFMKPMCCQDDAEHMYNYLVGMIARSPDGPWRIGAVRVTSVQKCERRSFSGHINAEQKKAILEAIRQRGVQFLSADGIPDRIVVQLTPEGEKMYRQMLHLRPAYADKRGSVYEFRCTVIQASNYFFKFGHHVKILEPESMAQSFLRRYLSAAKQYQ